MPDEGFILTNLKEEDTMFNRVVLIGRLTRDPEMQYIKDGTALTRFTLAVNRKFKKDEADFVDIVVWRGLAENCANYLSKGRLVADEGRLQIRSYEDKEGTKRKAVDVVADDVRFLESKNSGNNSSNNNNNNYVPSAPEPGPDPDDEIPF